MSLVQPDIAAKHAATAASSTSSTAMSKKLIEAAKHGDLKQVQDLINNNGADVNFSDANGLTALHWAIKSNHNQVVNFLINLPNTTLNQRSKNDGYTPLIIATLFKRTNIMKLLLDRGIPINDKDDNGYTALMHAVQQGDVGIILFLLQRRASMTETDNRGYTILSIAGHAGQVEVIRLLFNFGVYLPAPIIPWPSGSLFESAQELFDIASRRSSKDAKESIERQYRHNISHCLSVLLNGVNARRQSDGNTALHLAIKNGHRSLARDLIDAGASLVLTNNEGKTPVQIAREVNNFFIIATEGICEMRLLSQRMESSKALKAEFDRHNNEVQRSLVFLEETEKKDIQCSLNTILNPPRLSPLVISAQAASVCATSNSVRAATAATAGAAAAGAGSAASHR